MQYPTQHPTLTPSPFGRTWSAEIAARCEARRMAPDATSIALVLGGLLDSGLVDLATAAAIARGEIGPAQLDGYLLAFEADVFLACGAQPEGGAL